ncbi:glucokinase [Pararhizobium sp.]|uniref:glucokinase n=1 Tax=Pararhizobium sp. TaxID=1977563 RepID=UPI00272891E7|nr:glucokinase [Pararhizobium sp.]MDO9417875.1 glucokinase [Pararhizobium sp.]
MSSITPETKSFPFPILIGDIGGTNARFALLTGATSAPVQFPTVQTRDFPNIDDAIRATILANTSTPPRSSILAIAGPINGDEIPLTNAGWVIRPEEMLAGLGLEDIVVINDFEAQALAIAVFSDEHLEKIGRGERLEHASRVVLGPGTGLGVAGLLYARHTWFPVPGEGGHIDVGPRSERDYQIWPFLETIEGRISAEQLLCGRGLVNIYGAVSEADGQPPIFTTPADITAHGLSGDNRAAAETLSLFSTYLGRVAGDFAMVFMARGGVFLAGGISQKIISALRQPEFRAGFEDKAPHSALLAKIPTYVVLHPMAALLGLAAFARDPIRFGVATEGRRWRG